MEERKKERKQFLEKDADERMIKVKTNSRIKCNIKISTYVVKKLSKKK